MLRPAKLKRHNKKAMKKLKKLLKKFFNGDPPGYLNPVIANGELIPTILRRAEIEKSDLIIIKKAERIRERFRFFKKENADKLISEAFCPVMTMIHKPRVEGIKKILIPIDITKRTDAKVAWAISLSKSFEASIHIVSVLNMDIHRMNSLSYRKSKEIEAKFEEQGLKVDIALLRANSRPMEEVVLEHANFIEPDMILIMTHQESILFDNYLGNFASEIIHKSSYPVFSVVPGKETVVDGFFRSPAYKLEN